MKKELTFRLKPILASLFLIITLLANCRSRQPIRVGYSAVLSGFYSEIGISGRDAAQLALDQINAEGGINGVPLQLVTRDNKTSVGTTLKMMKELVQKENVVAIIGHNSSVQAAETLPFINQSRVVLIGCGASGEEFSGKKDFFFRVVPDNLVLGNAFADYVHKTYAYPSYNAAFDTTNRAFTESILKIIDKRLREYDEKIDVSIGFDSTAADLHKVAEQVAEGNPKGIILATSSKETSLLAQYLRQLGSQAQFFGTGWAHNITMLEKGGKAVQGMVLISNNTVLLDSPSYQDFSRRFFGRYNHAPGPDALHAYEAVEILAQALKQTGGKAEGLPEALMAIHDFPGVLGNISFDANGDVKRDVYIVKADGDHFTTVEVIPPQN